VEVINPWLQDVKKLRLSIEKIYYFFVFLIFQINNFLTDTKFLV